MDVFDRAFLKRNGSIQVAAACASRNQETARRFGADDHFGAGVQFSDEISLNLGVGIHVIVNVSLKLLAVSAEILLALSGREDVETVGFGDTVVVQPLKDNRGLLLVGHGGLLAMKCSGFSLNSLGTKASVPLKIPATVFRASWCFLCSSPTSAN